MTLKTIALAAAAAATLGTAAAADNSYFSFERNIDSASTLELGTVTAANAGVVEIYDFRGGSAGALLGTEMVAAGANSDVRINVGIPPQADVLAVLVVDGQPVAEREYLID